MIRCLAAVCLFSILIDTASAEASPEGRPEMRAYELQTAPMLDGEVLADAAWQGVVPATGFTQVQPEEGQPADRVHDPFVPSQE